MGTRNVTVVRADGVIKVAQYGQWDGYPTGQGNTIAHFLRTASLPKFKAKLRDVVFLSDDDIKKRWEECGADVDPNIGLVNVDVSNKLMKLYPALHRDTGAEVLELIYKGEVKELEDYYDFIKDTLFCEYAYIVDLDKEVVEIYASSTEPVKTMTIADFTKRNAMQKLEEELSE